MSVPQTVFPSTWRRPSFFKRRGLRYLTIAVILAYIIAAFFTTPVNWQRIVERGPDRMLEFLAGFIPPDFVSNFPAIFDGLIESLGMTIVSTAAGVLLSIPIGFAAAGNLVNKPVYFLCRGIIMVSRTFQEVILAIVLVAMFGLGPFAGILALTFATIGFFSKLLAEEIETIPEEKLDALRATGANWFRIWAWAVWPRVQPRILGLTLYRMDINFRESAVIGIVGAGGIGVVLNTSLDRFEYDTTAAVLVIIIAIVFAMELFSSWLRRKLL